MFKIIHSDGKARTGVLNTSHGKVKTPFFLPIATKGAFKIMKESDLKKINVEAIIANAFILYMKPGLHVIEHFHGIHKFMHWNKCVFTDSGGFQVLSKEFLVSLDEKGAVFRNPYTGKKELFTPEKAIEIQEIIGSDVAMALDDVPHYGKDREYVSEATRITHLWAERCIKAHSNKKQLLFGICQGGTFKDLREKSAAKINSLGFDGVALGGLGIGEGRENIYKMIKVALAKVDKNKPRYVMGIGSPEDILEAVSLGVDCFDSRYPTQNARHGTLFTKYGNINIEKQIYHRDIGPIDSSCDCYVCKHFSRAYIHHITKTKEPIREYLNSIHNLTFIQNLVVDIRESIKNNEFESFRKEFLKDFYKFGKRTGNTFNYK